MPDSLLPCPFCGAGTTLIKENGRIWTGQKYGEPSSVSVQHWCDPVEGQPSRMVERVGRDHASAIAAWNRRALSAPAAGEPELPVPDIEDDYGNDGHSPGQLRAYGQAMAEHARREALEEAAKVCDAERAEFMPQAGCNNGRSSDMAFGSVNSAERLAERIRAAAPPQGEPT